MHGVTYLVAAYAIAWIGLFVYFAFLMIRVRGIHTEFAAISEIVREQQERIKTHSNGYTVWEADKQIETYTDITGEE